MAGMLGCEGSEPRAFANVRGMWFMLYSQE